MVALDYTPEKLQTLQDVVGIALVSTTAPQLPPKGRVAGLAGTGGSGNKGGTQDGRVWCEKCPHGTDIIEGKQRPYYCNPYFAGTMRPGLHCNERKCKEKLAKREANGKAEIAAGKMTQIARLLSPSETEIEQYTKMQDRRNKEHAAEKAKKGSGIQGGRSGHRRRSWGHGGRRRGKQLLSEYPGPRRHQLRSQPRARCR